MKWYDVITWMMALNITFTLMSSVGLFWASGGITGFSITTLTIAVGVGALAGLLGTAMASSQPTIGKYISSEKNVFYGFIIGLTVFFTVTGISIMMSIDKQFGLNAPLSITTMYTAVFGVSSVMFILQTLRGEGFNALK